MLRFRVLFLLLLMLSFPAFGQKKAELDSLLQLLNVNSKEDSTRVKILNQLCWANRNNHLIEAVEFGKQGLELAKKIDYAYGKCEALNFLGVVYRNLGDYAEASKQFYEALHTAEKANILRQIAYSNNNIGDILKAQKKYQEALPYIEKALEIFEKMKDEQGLGFAYVRLGEIYQGLSIYEKSLDAFQKSLAIREKLGAKVALITSFHRLGAVYLANKDYSKSLEFYEKGLKMAEQTGEKRLMASSYDNIAWVYVHQKQYETAKQYALKGLELAEAVRSKEDLRNACFTLSQIAEDNHDYASALKYHKKFKILSDSIDNLEKSSHLAKMQTVYDTKKKDAENESLKQENQTTYVVFAIVVMFFLLAMVIGYVFYRNRQKQLQYAQNVKQKNETLVFLGKHRTVQTGDWENALTLISETVANALEVHRVGIWRIYDSPAQHLACLRLFDSEAKRNLPTDSLFFEKYPLFFQAISNQDNIIATDAQDNTYLSEFVEVHLKPTKIMSAICIPIFSDAGLWGLLACEYKYKKRKWENYETNFVKSVVDLITIAYQSYQRKKAEAELQKQYQKVMELNTTIERKKAKIEKNIAILLDLSKNEAISNGNWEMVGKEVTKSVVNALEVSLSQLWYYNFKEETFYNIGHCSSAGKPLPSPTLALPIFKNLLTTEKSLVIYDIADDEKLDEHSKNYFLELGVQSMILYPNILSEQQKGVLTCCHAAPRDWDMEDLAFMKSMDDEIMIGYQGYRRQQAQERIEKQSKEIAEKNDSLRTTLRLVKQEQKRTDELLLNILPFEIAEELRSEGYATPRHYELVTVLFTDLKGFTKIAEHLSPQEIIEELNTCFLAFDEICEKYNLEKIKTIGDAYMCAGGVPTPNTSNPVDTVNAALAMQKWMKEWADGKRAQGKQVWEIRIGIHSGEVVAGVVGKRKFAYDIWGDTVNTASRMESSGEIGKVNISGTTYQLVKDRFKCVFRGKVQAKNKGEIDMYFVEGKAEH
jgi:class 3 adenylate cyclase